MLTGRLINRDARPVLIFIILGLLLIGDIVVANADEDSFTQLFDSIIKKYWHSQVTINGVKTTVYDYARMSKDAHQPDSIFYQTLDALNNSKPQQMNKNQALAFWMNVYNFAAMRLIVENYPVDSIRSLKISLIKYPWSKSIVQIGEQAYSLKQIEKDILLRQYNDPRVIFGVSCAAVSCPDRIPQAFLASEVNEQLDEIIRAFFSNTKKGARLDTGAHTLTLSWILKKDGELFSNYENGILGFIFPYFNAKMQAT